MLSLLQWIFEHWAFWVPVIALFLGWAMGSAAESAQNQEQMERLARGIVVPEGWKTGQVVALLDGKPLDRAEMAAASLIIRSPLGGHGSGVCISSEGLILTNHHVVDEAVVVEVEHRGNSFLGRVVKRSAERDIALIKILSQQLTIPAIASGASTVGDDIFVAGTPLHLNNANLLTKGVLSKTGDCEGQNYLFIDASIAPGNSGGPVFNADGFLVGISVAVQTNADGSISHIGLAIPITEALQTLIVESDVAKPDGGPRAHAVIS